jgi:hypothetical protein
VIDMVKTKMETHTDSVYAVVVGSYSGTTTRRLTILSGGGDDKAYLHKIVPGTAAGTVARTCRITLIRISCVALNMLYITDDLTKP